MTASKNRHVHIVCPDDGHIVPRMAGWLRDGLGWTMSERASSTAVANYYMPYTAWGLRSIPSTETAAWFTHYEKMTLGKVQIWERASRKIGLRVTAASMYFNLLSRTGPVARVLPGVDMDHFRIMRQKRRWRLGLSAIYSGRKGNAGVAALAKSHHKEKFHIAGRGWPTGNHTWFDYEDMPTFYNSISVYVCTSLVEGIPAPPLEALACGTKIVVPRDVGMLDELPDSPGIRHYDRGDWPGMIEAIDQAIKDRPKKQDLRDLVGEKYPKQQWVDSHQRSFEAWLDHG